MKKLSFSIFLLILFSCGVKKSQITSTSHKILFVNYFIRKENNGEIKLTMKDYLIKDGQLKISVPPSDIDTIGNLYVNLLNKKNEIISSFILTNPLVKTIESTDSKGKLYKKTILLDSMEFSIRMQLITGSEFVEIREIETNKLKTTCLLKEKIDN